MTELSIIALIWWLVCVGLLLGSTLLVVTLRQPSRLAQSDDVLPPLSILVPLKNDTPSLGIATRSIFHQDYPDFDIIFSSVDEISPAIDHALSEARAQRRRRWAFVRTQPAAEGANPKVANLLQPYATARFDQIVIKDANTILPAHHLHHMVRELEDDVGLVSSAVILRGPETFPAWIECALVNTLGARLLLAGARLGVGVGIGAIMLIRRPAFDQAGGLIGISKRLADDHAIARQLRTIGMKTVLTPTTVDQIVGSRHLRDVFHRHVRWAACRRSEEPFVFVMELLTSGLSAAIAAALAAPLLGLNPIVAVLGTTLLWIGAEIGLAFAAGWPVRLLLAAAIPCRELVSLVIWLRAAIGPAASFMQPRS